MNNTINKKPIYILVTGGAGFIGGNFIPYFLQQYVHYHIINLDKITYAANLDNLTEVHANPRYQLVKGDICNRGLVEYLFTQYDIQGVFHFAAESHVDNSITGPEVFIKTNIEGTYTLLDVARKHWMEIPGKYRPGYEGCRFHHISTDEVYGSLGKTGLFTEETPYAPNSPYSASKASSDLIVRSYHHTYGMNIVITNSSNNYGPKQHAEKLIPTIIRKALSGEPIPIYGDGKNVRDWLFVLDHCQAIDLVYHKGRAGESYNIGAKNEMANIYVAQMVCEILDNLAEDHKSKIGLKSFKDLITFVEDRPGHDWRYAIDASKIEKAFGWRIEKFFKDGLFETIKWYTEHKL